MPGVRTRQGMGSPCRIRPGGSARRGPGGPVRLTGPGARRRATQGEKRQPEHRSASRKCPGEEALNRSADGAGDETEVNVPAAYEQWLRRGHDHIVKCSAGTRQYFPTDYIGNVRAKSLATPAATADLRLDEGSPTGITSGEPPECTHSLTGDPPATQPHNPATDLRRLSSRDRIVHDSVTLLPGTQLRTSIPINPMGKVGNR